MYKNKRLANSKQLKSPSAPPPPPKPLIKPKARRDLPPTTSSNTMALRWLDEQSRPHRISNYFDAESGNEEFFDSEPLKNGLTLSKTIYEFID